MLEIAGFIRTCRAPSDIISMGKLNFTQNGDSREAVDMLHVDIIL